jgi:hypothetical protein
LGANVQLAALRQAVIDITAVAAAVKSAAKPTASTAATPTTALRHVVTDITAVAAAVTAAVRPAVETAAAVTTALRQAMAAVAAVAAAIKAAATPRVDATATVTTALRQAMATVTAAVKPLQDMVAGLVSTCAVAVRTATTTVTATVQVRRPLATVAGTLVVTAVLTSALVPSYTAARDAEIAIADAADASRLIGLGQQQSAALQRDAELLIAARGSAAGTASRARSRIADANDFLSSYPQADPATVDALADARNVAAGALAAMEGDLSAQVSNAELTAILLTDDADALAERFAVIAPLAKELAVSHEANRITEATRPGEEVLVNTEGRVDDNSVRQGLREALDAAYLLRDSLTFSGTFSVDPTIAGIATAAAAVNDAVVARDARLAAEAAAAAERAARQAAAARAARTAASRAAAQAPPGQAAPAPPAVTGGVAETEAARLGVAMQWGGTQGHAGAYAPGSGVIRIGEQLQGASAAMIRSVVRHEAAHVYIERICGTINPPVASGAFENVTDAYANMFLGGTSWMGYGYNASHAAAATAIRNGNCG